MTQITRRTAFVLALLAAPTLAQAADPTATAIRIGDHPGFVRVVVDRTVAPSLDEFAGADSEIGDGSVTVDLPRTRIGALRPITASGVTVTPTSTGRTLRLRITAPAGRFKYYGDRVLGRRVVMDLWKARPVFPAAARRDAGCLAVGTLTPDDGRIAVRGIGRGLFENALVVVVRNAAGRVVARRPLTATGFPNSTWSTTVRYRVGTRQTGTLEAVDMGGRVGDLCLAQIPVTLRPAP